MCISVYKMYVSLLDPKWNTRRLPLLLWSLITYKLIASIISLYIQLRLVCSYLQGDGKKNRKTVNQESLWLLCSALCKGILCLCACSICESVVLACARIHTLSRTPSSSMHTNLCWLKDLESMLVHTPNICSSFPGMLLKSQSFHARNQQELMAELWL